MARRFSLPACLTLVLPLVLLCTATAWAQDDTRNPEQPTAVRLPDGARPLSEVIARNWNGWAAGRPALTKLDAIALMPDAAIQGEDAAALAALEKFLRTIPSADRAAACAINDPKALSFYAASVRKLRAANRSLFPNAAPTFNALEQGPAGDCYFFSGTGWMAKYRPQTIVQAITALPGNRFLVRFPGGDSAEVAAPTDAEMANNNAEATLKDGLWMPVLEKAMGLLMQRLSPKAADIPDPSVAVNVPGKPAVVVGLWTGNPVRGLHLGGKTARQDLRDALVRMKAKNSLAEVLLLKKPAARLPYDHVYAVLDFDSGTDTLTLWNPWGTDYTPPCPSSPACGYARTRGAFQLPLDDFDSFFTFLAIEQN